MKTSHLFFTSLIASTAWADAAKSWVFFAKVKDTLMPLSQTSFAGYEDYLSSFSYGDLSAAPMQFNLTEDKYAYGRNQEAVGFVKPLFAFGSAVTPTSLKLDSDQKLGNGRFYSCKSSADSEVRRIFYEMRMPRPECFKVDIYVLPVQNTPVVPIKLGLEAGNDAERKVQEDDLSWAFFAKKKGKFMPLSRNAYPGIGPNISAFSFGDVPDVSEFTFQDGYAISTDTNSVDDVDNSKSFFGVGPALHRIKLKLDAQMRVRNKLLYSCSKVNGRNIITDNVESKYCVKVKVYFLRYDKKTGTVVTKQQMAQEETNVIASGTNQSNSAAPVPKKLPYTFFAKVNGDNVPLGARIRPVGGVKFSEMGYGPGISNPIEFDMMGDGAISLNTINDGFVGIHDNMFAFGPTIGPNNLMLDADSMLHNANYFSCGGLDNFQLITTKKFFPECFPVSIYLLHNGVEATNPTIEPSSDHQDISAEAHKTVAKTGVQNEASSADDTVAEETSVLSTPSVASNLSYVLFAKVEDALTPLSGKVIPELENDDSVMYWNSEPPNPVEFILEDGQYAKSIGTPTDGYLALYRDMLAFGVDMTRGKLNIDADGRLTNCEFYTCRTGDVAGNVIAVEIINESCKSVDIYIKHSQPTTGKSMKHVH